ncbi:MAG: hypothetical protein ABI679_11520 [Gemmatimonadota bacterium]
MPGAYNIDPHRHLVLSRGWGVVTNDDFMVHARELTEDPRFQPTFSQLSDLRDAERLELDTFTVRRLAAISPFGAGSRRALVVSSDLAFGMARMFQTLREGNGEELQVFRDIDAALDWLGLAAEKDAVIAQLPTGPGVPPGADR